ncbi:hypothetical protein AB0N14_13490 [Streptomyces sp. NPDC051104]|uniref:hypothetical protein n=1 Tax=Streptomyces sp. NPDC051104 TaxID=3155044 RepID=UPI00341C1F35
MAWASKVPAAIDGLVAAFTDWPGLAGVTVRDGPSTSQATLMEVVSVGYTGGEEEIDAESALVGEGLGGSPDREQLTIRCAAAVLRGGDDIVGARARAFQLLSEAGAAIAANRTLGGAVMRARVASHSLSQSLTQQGAQVIVMFEVSCDTYTGR